MPASQHDDYDRPPQRPLDEEGRYSSRPKGGRNFMYILLGLLLGGGLTLALVVLLAPRLIGTTASSASTTIPLPVLPSPAPTPTPKIITGAAVIQQIQQLNRLESAMYSVETVVTVERPGGFLNSGYQKLLVIVRGNVVAGIDLGKIKVQDIVVSKDGKAVTVRMPEAEILSKYLDESQTQVYDHQTGFWTDPDTALLIEAQKAGAEKILQGACEDGILSRATKNARQSLEQMLGGFAFERVEVIAAPVPSCPVVNSATPATTTVP